MSRTPEENRRRDVCIECKLFKPIKAKGMCQNCWHKVKRRTQPEFFLRTRYTELVQRCINPNNSGGRYLGKKYCTRKEFLDKFLTDLKFNQLFIEWQESGRVYSLVPSIDRIDSNGGYTLDNMQFITHSENTTKDQPTTPVIVSDELGNEVARFISQNEAARQLKIPQANIWKVLNGQRRKAGGFLFRFA